MRRIAVCFFSALLVFCAWLSVRRWEFLTLFDVTIVVLQSVVPLLGVSALAVALIRRRHPLRQVTGRVGLLIVAVYPIWLLGWLLSMGCVYLLARVGIGVDLLNNSFQFVSSFASNWSFPIMGALIVAVVGALVTAAPR